MRFAAEKSRLVAVLIAILAIGFLANSLLNYVVSSDSVRKNIIDQQLPLTGDNVYSEIQRDLLRPINVSKQMAHDTFMRDWILNGEKDDKQLLRYLAEIKARFGANTSFLVSERSRKYYYAEGVLKTVSDSDPNDQWYARVRAMKEPYEINVDTDKAHRNTLTTFINFQVQDYDGRFIGATGVGITLNAMRELIERYEDKYKRRVFFVDAEGDVTLAGQAIGEQIKSIQQLPGLAELAPKILSHSEEPTQLSYTQGRGTVQVNSRFIPELKWYLIVEENEAASVGPLRNMLGLNLLISTLATVLVLSMTLYTVNRFQRRLEHVASTDALSGLANREMGEILLDQAMRDALRFKTPLCAVMLDIDHFKRINDTCGHLGGDSVIQQVGALLRGAVRRNDVVARWGGEEFLVLMVGCPLKEAVEWSEKMRAQLAALDFTLRPSPGNITASFGVVEFGPTDTRHDFLSRADAALYKAKSHGRNRVDIAEQAVAGG